jgi:hypothetical protein
MATPDAKIPEGSIAEKWDNHKFSVKLVNPANKRKFDIIVVGTGLAGASAAASLAELGYNVKVFTYHDSPRRAHSIAAQGGINAAKNYRNDGDSVHRLFYDTVKGGDYRSREANVHRLAQVSVDIIDQCAAQGVPFAREYGGLLANRSFGGAQVSRTFYARGQTGQQLLIGAYQALAAQIAAGKVTLHNRADVLDVVVKDGEACGIVARDMLTGQVQAHSAHAVVLATGGYGNVYYLSTNAMACNVSASWRAHRKGALFANPCYTQIHPTCIPAADEFQSKLTLMSESLRNDGRIWVPRDLDEGRTVAEQGGEVVADGVGQDEVAIGQALHERRGAEPVGAMVGEVRLTKGIEPRDAGHQVVVDPEAAHRVVGRGVDAHRHRVGVLAGDALVHVEQVAVALSHGVLAVAADGIGEIEVDAVLERTNPPALVDDRLRIARGDVAWHEVAERGVLLFEVVVPLGVGDVRRRAGVVVAPRHPDSAVVAQ